MKLVVFLFFCIHFTSWSLEEKTVPEILKFSKANLQGQKSLYNEGWLVISSTKKSFDYANEHLITTAKNSWVQWGKSLRDNSKDFSKNLKNNPEVAKKVYQYLERWGPEGRKEIKKGTKKLVKLEFEYGKENFRNAWGEVLLGTIFLNRLTEDDRNKISSLITSFPGQIKSDYRNLKKWMGFLRSKKRKTIEDSWKLAFSKAGFEWHREYEKSSKKKNTLLALPYVLWGNIKAIWYGLIKPGGEKAGSLLATGAKKSAKWTAKILLLPPVAVMMVTGRTVYNLGGVLYYTGKMGARVLSQTVEAGLLASMGTLSFGSIAPTYVAGQGLAYINQVAMTALAGGASGGTFVTSTALDTINSIAHFSYDIAKETSKVIVGSGSSAIVLGYNALTALPTQTFFTLINSAAFLVWDGPRLAVYRIRGKIKDSSIEDLPVGAVLDFNKIKKLEIEGLEVDVLTKDQEVIKKILEQLPKDLRIKNE
jgi:hypothetical protein